MAISFPMMYQHGWVCPKCGRVYAPYVGTCYPCNAPVGTTTTNGTGAPLPPAGGTTSGGA